MLSTSCCYFITPQSHHPKLLFTTNPYLSSSRILFLSTTLIFPLLGGPFPSLLYLYRLPAAWRNKERFSWTLLLPNLPFSLSLHPFNCQLCSLICLLLFPSKHCWCLISNSSEVLCTYPHLSWGLQDYFQTRFPCFHRRLWIPLFLLEFPFQWRLPYGTLLTLLGAFRDADCCARTLPSWWVILALFPGHDFLIPMLLDVLLADGAADAVHSWIIVFSFRFWPLLF